MQQTKTDIHLGLRGRGRRVCGDRSKSSAAGLHWILIRSCSHQRYFSRSWLLWISYTYVPSQFFVDHISRVPAVLHHSSAKILKEFLLNRTQSLIISVFLHCPILVVKRHSSPCSPPSDCSFCNFCTNKNWNGCVAQPKAQCACCC